MRLTVEATLRCSFPVCSSYHDAGSCQYERGGDRIGRMLETYDILLQPLRDNIPVEIGRVESDFL